MSVDVKLIDRWAAEQLELKKKLVMKNSFNWILEEDDENSGEDRPVLKYIGGLDLSFIKGNDSSACVGLVVLAYPSLEIVYRDFKMVKLDAPYLPGFLAFREVDHMLMMLEELRAFDSDLMPEVMLIDGNGFLHPRGFGLACHFGVLSGIPTIGVAKNFLVLDGFGMMEVKGLSIKECPKKGDWVKLVGESGTCWGASLTVNDGGKRPLYISVGHLIDLETAIEVVKKSCRYRIPEPIRQADLGSREFIRSGKVEQKF